MNLIGNTPPCEITARDPFGQPIDSKPREPNGVFIDRDGEKYECWIQREFISLVNIAPFGEDELLAFRFWGELIANQPKGAKFKVPAFTLIEALPNWLPERLKYGRKAKKKLYERYNEQNPLNFDFECIGGMPRKSGQISEIVFTKPRAKPVSVEFFFPDLIPVALRPKKAEPISKGFDPSVLEVMSNG